LYFRLMSESKPLLSVNDANDHLPSKPNVLVGIVNTIKQNKSIVFWCVGCILSSVLQGVYIKQAGNALANFPYFLFWFTAIPFVILFFLYYWGVLLFTKQITPEMRKAQQYKMAIIGVLTAVNGIFILFASPNVPGTMQALLGPTIVTIPMAMVLSFIMLKRRYNFYQLFAVLVILFGLGIAIWPSLHQSGGSRQFGSFFWNSMFVIGSLPAAASSVYEEKAFDEQPIHIAYMLSWSTLWQMIAIFASFPVDAIPHFGTASSFPDIFTNQVEAFHCLIGKPTDLTMQLCPTCDCGNAGLYVSLFIVFYVLSSFFSLGVVKYGNAAFSFIVQTISTPLTEFAFAWTFLMGASQVESISPYNYASLAFLLLGVIIYRVFDRQVNASHSITDIINAGDTGDSSVSVLAVNAVRSYSTVQPRLYVKNINPSVEREKLPEDASWYWTYP